MNETHKEVIQRLANDDFDTLVRNQNGDIYGWDPAPDLRNPPPYPYNEISLWAMFGVYRPKINPDDALTDIQFNAMEALIDVANELLNKRIKV